MKTLPILVLLILAVPAGADEIVAAPASGQDVGVWTTANDLHAWCSSKVEADETACHAYIRAISEVVANDRTYNYRACIPKGVSATQAKDIVKNWLQAHPEQRHYAAYSTVARIIAEAFPCLSPK